MAEVRRWVRRRWAGSHIEHRAARIKTVRMTIETEKDNFLFIACSICISQKRTVRILSCKH